MPDRHYPALHVRPARGWVNDPNGLCRIDGVWHVFLQWNPDAPVHDRIHWGHLSSPDLLHWTEQPVALVPRADDVDAVGCWSGCVVVDDGVPTAVYTAVPRAPEDGVVALARSDRSLVGWQPGGAVAGFPADHQEQQGVEQVRDPFLLEVDGRRYAVQGAGSLAGPPRLLAYDATDLERWVPLGALLDHTDPIAAEHAPAQIWECPNLVRVDDVWLLLVSRWQMTEWGQVLDGVTWLTGDLDTTDGGLCFRPTAGGPCDDGPAFYAPQVMTADGRVLLFGWAWELDRSEDDVRRAGWAGTLTHPRELHVVDGRLHMTPAAELESLRAEPVDPSVPLEVTAFEAVGDGVRLELVDDGTEPQTVWSGDGPVRILVDGSVVEVFGGDGTAYTTRAYPAGAARWRVAGADAVWAHRLPAKVAAH